MKNKNIQNRLLDFLTFCRHYIHLGGFLLLIIAIAFGAIIFWWYAYYPIEHPAAISFIPPLKIEKNELQTILDDLKTKEENLKNILSENK